MNSMCLLCLMAYKKENHKNYKELTNVCHIADLISLTDWVEDSIPYTLPTALNRLRVIWASVLRIILSLVNNFFHNNNLAWSIRYDKGKERQNYCNGFTLTTWEDTTETVIPNYSKFPITRFTQNQVFTDICECRQAVCFEQMYSRHLMTAFA